MARQRILVVEDDEAIASGLARVLDSQGYDVTRVGGGRAALVAAADPLDLVILDLGLPDMDGIDVCRTLRRGPPQLPIPVPSARDEGLDVGAGPHARAGDHPPKPLKLAELPPPGPPP